MRKSVYDLKKPLLVMSVFTMIACSLCSFTMAGEFTKTIKREFDISANGTTYLSNKYGKIEVKTWDKNRVKIAVTIVVKEGSEEDAQKVFNAISVNFSNGADYVKAETAIEQIRRSWIWDDGKADYKINYEVYVPTTINLQVDQRYGDVYLASVSGKTKLTVKYGNFKTESVGDGSNFELAYGNGSIDHAENAYVGLSYSKLTINEANDLSMNSAYSGLNASKLNSLTTTAKYDNYTLGTIKSLKATGMYSKFSATNAGAVNISGQYNSVAMSEISKSLDLDLNYGSCNVSFSKGLTNATIKANYTDVTMKVLPDLCCYQLDAAANYAGVRYPQAMNVTYEVQKPTSHVVKGHVGKSDAPIIKASVNYGGIKVLGN
ncbi:hypothetical protein [Haliscomenobacter hydrossis]|uniref:Adhesin domain-containing protein n=1 Tax=Haliscomenobacter hydrossis (strain ATCC 27775 / DSM 1100 / LMG 10767 / O) TaxID=760192 RepID=F4KXM8_HALH1|nr:hypothetical protein [Haliscomenobacter hydrossis]AEE51389.1 hypothetical protein Halhy_3534 [Haliscomenobacter hydrossis DSM 1100]